MMAAIRASQLKCRVTIIEKNASLGRKLLLSGKGRCNLTNACDLESFLKRFSQNGRFLRDAFRNFFNQDLIRFFEENGLPLKVERQLRVFPVTDKSNSVLQVLKQQLGRFKVNIIYNATVKEVTVEGQRVTGVRIADGRFIPADKVILATGGMSYRFTGSSGDGFRIAQGLGHTIAPLRAGLIPLVIKEAYPKKLEGLTLKNIRLQYHNPEKRIISDIGELLFTGFGISGPLVLSLSAKVLDLWEKDKPVYVGIDLKPALSYEQLNARLLREFKANPKKTVKNVFRNLLPQRLADMFIDIAKIPTDKNVSQVTQEERKRLVCLLKDFRMEIKGVRPIEEGMVTRGGVSLKEVNPRTMESRLIKGLYFCGELLDVDADTGGFNLQAAFSTGYLAGENSSPILTK